MGETRAYVLDSFALLAYLGDEPGADRVQGILREGESGEIRVYLNVVNLGEVYYIIYREQGRDRAEEALTVLDLLPIEQVEVDRPLALAAALIKATYPVAYADAFAAALAQRLEGAVVTGDPEFEKLGEGVEILWLPQPA